MIESSTVAFYAYKPNGEIVASGYCPACDADKQAYPGAIVAVGPGKFREHFVEAGVLVPMPPRPTRHHTFSYTAKAWEFDSTGAWQEVRQQRNTLLAASDWTQLPDVPLETISAWTAYRQALRDVTSQADPLNIVWPQVPG